MITLYHSLYSTCSQKVRLVLAEKGLEFESRIIDFATLEHLSDDYLALNPNGVVPTLVDNEEAIIDSSVICEYLDDTHPETSLTPTSAVARANMRAWMRFLEEVPTAAIRVPSFNQLFSEKLAALDEQAFDAIISKTPLRKTLYRALRNGETFKFDQSAIDDSMEKLDYTLERANNALSSKPWLIGDELTIADCVLLPTVIRMLDLGLEHHLKEKQHLIKWLDNFMRRPSFSSAFPQGARTSDKAWSFNNQAGDTA